jgi:hypothetical protein
VYNRDDWLLAARFYRSRKEEGNVGASFREPTVEFRVYTEKSYACHDAAASCSGVNWC